MRPRYVLLAIGVLAAWLAGIWYERRHPMRPAVTSVAPAASVSGVSTLHEHVKNREQHVVDYNRLAAQEEGYAEAYVQQRFHEARARALCGRALSASAPPGTWDCVVSTDNNYYDVSCVGATCEGTRTE